MIVKSLMVGMVGTNCYIVINEENNNKALIIDPGAEADKIISEVKENEADPVAILLTHAHFDHIGALKEVSEKYGIPVYMSKEEKAVAENPAYNLTEMAGGGAYTVNADTYVNDGEILDIAGFSIECILTPGHTPGGLCYFFREYDVLFSGDTLFWESVGRTDFPGGHMGNLIKSVKEKLFVLPDDVIVYPGHDIVTSIGNEKKNNMFLK